MPPDLGHFERLTSPSLRMSDLFSPKARRMDQQSPGWEPFMPDANIHNVNLDYCDV